MAQDSDRPAFSADIPAEAVAAALEAVERGGGAPDPAPARVPPASGDDPGRAAPSDVAAQLETLRTDLAQAEARAAELSDRLAAERERLLRAAADLENQRKRAARERDDVQRYGNERLVKELLPALDGLDRALAAAPADEPLARGVAMVRRLLEDALGRFGVRGFSSKGEPFDPRVHEALMTVASADRPPGTILDEHQRGFFLHDRLIRPAAVVVATAVAPTDPAGGPDAAPEPGGEGAGRPPTSEDA